MHYYREESEDLRQTKSYSERLTDQRHEQEYIFFCSHD